MEKVLVVPRDELFAPGAIHGVSRENNEKYLSLIESKSLFMDRKFAEEDRTHKQIIPYALITSGNQIFMVTRLGAQGEARLHQKVSIGLGGHINPPDGKSNDKPWETGLRRELSEEVSFTGEWKSTLVGMLNDDSTPVGSVHFGLVYRVKVVSGEVRIEEKDKMTGAFFYPHEVALFYTRMESWSQLVFSTFWSEFMKEPAAIATQLSARE